MHLILSLSLKCLRIEWYCENVQWVGGGAVCESHSEVGESPDRKVEGLH